MKITFSLIKIFLSTIIFLVLIEFLTRIILFIPTNINVFKYGFKKSVIFEIVDLTKLQIIIVDKDKKIKSEQGKKTYDEKIWIFGGSTTYGYLCEGGQSSSWPDELLKINKYFKFKNFAFSGANSDSQINLLYKNLEKSSPKIIFWANKFNTKNIIGSTDYRNKHILNYEFKDANKTNFFLKIKRLDKSLKSYSLFYSMLDKILFRVVIFLKNKGIFQTIEIIPSDEDILMSLKNFEINTIEAIELSKKHGVNEFYIVSLFSEDDIKDKKRKKIVLYDEVINKIGNKYYPYVKIIKSTINLTYGNQSIYLCDKVHKTLKGNKAQAEIINHQLLRLSKFLNDNN